MIQDAFPWGERCQVGRAKWGTRKAQIVALARGELLELPDLRSARCYEQIARRLGLRCSFKQKTRGTAGRVFEILGPFHGH